MSPIEKLTTALCRLPGVTQATSRFGSRGLAWFVARREFAHLHADDVIDLRLPRARQAKLRDDPRARFRTSRSEWVELEFHSAEDVAHVVDLAQAAYAAARNRATT